MIRSRNEGVAEPPPPGGGPTLSTMASPPPEPSEARGKGPHTAPRTGLNQLTCLCGAAGLSECVGQRTHLPAILVIATQRSAAPQAHPAPGTLLVHVFLGGGHHLGGGTDLKISRICWM